MGRGANTPSAICRGDLRSACVAIFSATSVMNRGDRREPIFKDDADPARFLEPLGIPNDSPAGHRQFAARMEEQWGGGGGADDGWEYGRIQRGWCCGEDAFRKELLGQMVGRAGDNHYAEQRQESDAEKARRIVAAELKRLNWTESQLRGRRKGDPKKVRIARRLREKTTMTLKWIAGELHMGTWTHVSNLLSQARRGRT